MVLKELILFTNRNCVGFDETGKEIPQIHTAISYSEINRGLAILMINTATTLYLSKFREWRHEISRDEMKAILGLNDDQQEKIL